MRAVEQLNPSYGRGEYVPYAEYPRQDWPAYSDRHEDDPAVVASGRFQLDEADITAVEDTFVDGIVADADVTVHRDYQNERHWDIDLDETACLEYLLETDEFDDETQTELREAETFSELSGDALQAVESELGGDPLPSLAAEIGTEGLAERLPEFRYSTSRR